MVRLMASNELIAELGQLDDLVELYDRSGKRIATISRRQRHRRQRLTPSLGRCSPMKTSQQLVLKWVDLRREKFLMG